MPLSDDQRALLLLLLEGDQTYSDVDALIGQGPGQARERAVDAVRSLGATGVAATDELVDYLLGQGDAAVAAGAQRALEADLDLAREAARLKAQLRLITPPTVTPPVESEPSSKAPAETPASEGEEEALPERITEPPEPEPPEPTGPEPTGPEPTWPEPTGPEPTGPADAGSEKTGSVEAGFTGLDGGQKRLLAGLAAISLIVLALVLGVSGVLGSDDEPEERPAAEETAGEQNPGDGTASPDEMVGAVLVPRGGSNARGEALFGSIEGAPAIRVTAEGLEPTGAGDEYIVWLYRSDAFALRLGGAEVGQEGLLAAQLEIPAEVLALVAQGAFRSIDVSRAPRAAYVRELDQAREDDRAPRHVGQTVLRGPIVGPGMNAQNSPDTDG